MDHYRFLSDVQCKPLDEMRAHIQKSFVAEKWTILVPHGMDLTYPIATFLLDEHHERTFIVVVKTDEKRVHFLETIHAMAFGGNKIVHVGPSGIKLRNDRQIYVVVDAQCEAPIALFIGYNSFYFVSE